jgi:hypothetical protein
MSELAALQRQNHDIDDGEDVQRLLFHLCEPRHHDV